MNIPESIMILRLSDGRTLQECTGGDKPTSMPITDVQSFQNVWEQRLKEAKAKDISHLCNKAQAILTYLASHDNIVLLLWPKQKVTALFCPDSGDVLILD